MPLFAYFYNMKYAIAIIGSLCVFASCQYFSTEKISSESIYEEELKSINWTDVDTFPAFPGCDDLIAQEAQKNCFKKPLPNLWNISCPNNRWWHTNPFGIPCG